MRVNSVALFAEKDAVKAHGARWDAAKKLWDGTNVADLTPFLHWIPNLEAATDESSVGAKRQTTISEKTPAKHSTGVITQSTIEVPRCGCSALPWEDCEHSATP